MIMRHDRPAARLLMVLALMGLLPGCEVMDSAFSQPEAAAPAAPAESYHQEPVRNQQLGVQVSWTYAYQPADTNAAQVWSTETGPSVLREELNRLGGDDGNTFVAATPGNTQINITVHQYSNGQAGDAYGSSLMAEMWALGHTGMVCTLRTGSYSNDSAAARDMAGKIYSWLHGGWHTHDFD